MEQTEQLGVNQIHIDRVIFINSAAKECSFKSYVFQCTPHYDNLGLVYLAEMFAVDESTIIAWITQLISHDCLPASIDLDKKLVVIKYRGHSDEIAALIATYGEKLNMLLEANEKQALANPATLRKVRKA